LFACITIRYII